MRWDDAYRCMAPLVVATNGWNDENVQLYVSELARLERPDLLCGVITDLIRDRGDTYRPALGAILRAYRRESQRLALESQVAQWGDGTPFAQAIAIVRDNYVLECQHRGAEPHWDYFDKMFGAALAKAAAR